jgi:hypothetical protein
MSFLVASLPPVQCFVRKEFLYDFEKGHGELEPAIWVSIKSIKGQAFRIESLLPNYGALYDKLPIHAYCWKPLDNPLPLDHLQIWDALGYHFTILEKATLKNLKAKFYGKDRQWHYGQYMFTLDHGHPDANVLDVSLVETAEEHKSFNFIKLDNGQFACQPNNRVLYHDASLTIPELKRPDFKVCTQIYICEQSGKWSAGGDSDFFYDIKERVDA